MNIHTKYFSLRNACIILAALLMGATCVSAQTPTLIPFQGRLTDQSGIIVQGGAKTIIFNLYDVPVGGTALWTERHENVGIIDGMVNVFLGSIKTFPERASDGDNDPNNDPLFFAETKYLGITVDDPTTSQDIEMIPRQMILPAFHARSADTLNGHDWSAILVSGNNPAVGFVKGSKIQTGSITSAQLGDRSVREIDLEAGAVSGGTGGTITDGSITEADLSTSLSNAIVPIGAILPYAGNSTSVPDGWMLCNGAALPRSNYPALFAAIGTIWGTTHSTNFLLPDMRGRIPAGKTDGATKDRLNPTLENPNDINNPISMLNSTVLGAVGGEDMHQLTVAELAEHGHRIYGNTGGSGSTNGLANGVLTGDERYTREHFDINVDGVPHIEKTGGDAPHNNVQPTIIVNYIIRVE